MLGLRLRSGIDFAALSNRYNVNALELYDKVLRSLVDEGLIEVNSSVVRLTMIGLTVADSVAQEFLA